MYPAASLAMNAGNVLMPVTLFVAAAWRPAKYALAIPSLLVFVALVIVAVGVTRHGEEGRHGR